MPAESEGDTSSSNLLAAAKWRRRAEECRAESKDTKDVAARRAMALIANFYDEMASLLETRSDQAPLNNKKVRKKRSRKR